MLDPLQTFVIDGMIFDFEIRNFGSFLISMMNDLMLTQYRTVLVSAVLLFKILCFGYAGRRAVY